MVRSPVKTPSRTRRDEILQEAAALFARNGVVATTMRQIADTVGILAGSLYHHFESKEDIVDEVLSSSLTELLGWYRDAVQTNAHPAARLQALIHASFRSIEEHPDACAIYMNDRQYLSTISRFTTLESQVEKIRKTWIEVLDEGMRSGSIRPDLDADVTFRFVFYPIWLTVGWYEKSGHSLGELADDYADFVLRALSLRSKRR